MDNSLVLKFTFNDDTSVSVLILFVMDNSLVLTSTVCAIIAFVAGVLILVVMDNSLVLTVKDWMEGVAKVLILVVMDNSLVQNYW